MSGGRFELGDEFLRLTAEERIKNHGWNTDRETGTGVDQRLADSLRQQNITRSPQICAERAERANDSQYGAKQAEQRHNHSDIGQINYAIVQTRCDPGA